MAPLICLIVSFLFFRFLGRESRCFADWHFAIRAALGAMFLLAGMVPAALSATVVTADTRFPIAGKVGSLAAGM
jgi:hypothetical protein